MNPVNNVATSSQSGSRRHRGPSVQLHKVVMLVVIVALVMGDTFLVPMVSARYLPTRSNVDQARRQRIKDVLRTVSRVLLNVAMTNPSFCRCWTWKMTNPALVNWIATLLSRHPGPT